MSKSHMVHAKEVGVVMSPLHTSHMGLLRPVRRERGWPRGHLVIKPHDGVGVGVGIDNGGCGGGRRMLMEGGAGMRTAGGGGVGMAVAGGCVGNVTMTGGLALGSGGGGGGLYVLCGGGGGTDRVG